MNPEPLFFGFRGQEYPIGEFLNCRICERKTTYPDLDCRQDEAEYMPLTGDAVDYVFANMYLHHLNDVTVDCVGSNC